MVLTDWVLLTALLLSVVLGLWRGLVYEVLSVAGWVAAFVLAQAFADQAGAWLPVDGLSPPLRLAAGFVLVFVVVAFAAGMGAWLVQKLVASVGLRPVDRVLGGAFGLLRGVVILLAVALVVSMTQMQAAAWWRDSVTASVLSATLHQIKPLLPEVVARYIR
ncbi:CvpA family protein [Hydrogenophaga laconesensis]|uniref:Membrane protein required for colicin V production n=1 Tax=Hydrogenophaga laconesensis TaxID=1805971 RepID=A0ABU1V8L5_9BURK|nr:CvpA family protein [Hydrogenophaga laconesensis]MDR7093767.1 membrane protein required for colicin V production [Hydrogenophaga laconesensis]